jgi:glycosyltransferase involved in cell wall biosynthesis
MKFKESALAHQLLDGLKGIEIGGSAHNSFGLKTLNVDYRGGSTPFKDEEIRLCGEALPVDILAPGDDLPLPDNSQDFVISSHVIEHFSDPIRALKEWRRVVRPGGYIYVIAPHKERTFDRERQRTTLAELIERHKTGIGPDPDAAHCSVWITEDFVELVNWLGWPIAAVQDSDDKVGNGFAVVIKVEKNEAPKQEASQPVRSVAKPQNRLSMTVLLGPTHKVRTGGAACMLEYARRFQERGHDVSITTWPQFLWPEAEPFPGLGFDIPIHFDRNARRDVLPFNLVNQTPRDYLGELQFFLTYLNLLTPAIPKSDVILVANWDCIIPAWQSGKGKVVHFPMHYDEVFFTLDGDPSASLLGNPLIKLLCRSAFQMPMYRIANSSWLAGEIRRRTGEKVPFVTHGIDAGRFVPQPKLSAKDGIVRVVTYSRPEKWKGFQDAVPAMQELMRRYPGKIEWHVYGFAHPHFAPDNSLAPYKFHSTLEHDQLARLYAESDIVLCPSWYESYPLPPIEAMACGTAVVTTPYGTEDYAIDGHTAIIVRPRIISDFVAALDGLVRMPELRARLARNGRAMAEGHSWDGAVRAREVLLWRIHRNQMSASGLKGFENGIEDGYGVPFEQITPDTPASEGQLLRGEDGNHYLVESGRLRKVANPSALGLDPANTQTLDLLSLLRNTHGAEITSPANFYSVRTAVSSVSKAP